MEGYVAASDLCGHTPPRSPSLQLPNFTRPNVYILSTRAPFASRPFSRGPHIHIDARIDTRPRPLFCEGRPIAGARVREGKRREGKEGLI